MSRSTVLGIEISSSSLFFSEVRHDHSEVVFSVLHGVTLSRGMVENDEVVDPEGVAGIIKDVLHSKGIAATRCVVTFSGTDEDVVRDTIGRSGLQLSAIEKPSHSALRAMMFGRETDLDSVLVMVFDFDVVECMVVQQGDVLMQQSFQYDRTLIFDDHDELMYLKDRMNRFLLAFANQYPSLGMVSGCYVSSRLRRIDVLVAMLQDEFESLTFSTYGLSDNLAQARMDFLVSIGAALKVIKKPIRFPSFLNWRVAVFCVLLILGAYVLSIENPRRFMKESGFIMEVPLVSPVEVKGDRFVFRGVVPDALFLKVNGEFIELDHDNRFVYNVQGQGHVVYLFEALTRDYKILELKRAVYFK